MSITYSAVIVTVSLGPFRPAPRRTKDGRCGAVSMAGLASYQQSPIQKIRLIYDLDQ
jgi:hypothetical protein